MSGVPASSRGTGAAAAGYEIGYAQVTANVNITDTAEATGTALITCGPFTYDGAPVMAEFFAPAVLPPNVISDAVIFSIFEGSTQLGRIAAFQNQVSGTSEANNVTGRYRFTPSAGSHTYLLCAFVAVTTGTPKIFAGSGGVGGYLPAFLRFTKV